jgi:hypothetical protein
MSRLQARSTDISTQWSRRRADMLRKSVTTLPKIAIQFLQMEVYALVIEPAIVIAPSDPGLTPRGREGGASGQPSPTAGERGGG